MVAPDTCRHVYKTRDQARGRLWAQRLKRVIDIDICHRSGGAVRVIACIEDPAVIGKIPSIGP